MREILFKAKRIDNGEWIEGAYCPNSCDSFLGEMRPKPSIIKLGGEYDGFWFDVIPETVCQYTGLQDKNGKKVFENDILSDGKEKWFVEYGKTSTGFHADNKTPCDCRIFSLYHLCNKHNEGREVEVIGNIHDRSGERESDN